LFCLSSGFNFELPLGFGPQAEAGDWAGRVHRSLRRW